MPGSGQKTGPAKQVERHQGDDKNLYLKRGITLSFPGQKNVTFTLVLRETAVPIKGGQIKGRDTFTTVRGLSRGGEPVAGTGGWRGRPGKAPWVAIAY